MSEEKESLNSWVWSPLSLAGGCSYGPEHNMWMASVELNDCEALDNWYKSGGDGPDMQ